MQVPLKYLFRTVKYVLPSGLVYCITLAVLQIALDLRSLFRFLHYDSQCYLDKQLTHFLEYFMCGS